MADPPAPSLDVPDPDLTRDPILRGRLVLWQPRMGYRFSVDSLLLVHFVGEAPYGRVIDLGAGVGVIGLALAVRDPSATVTLLELQPRMARLARSNVEGNGGTDRVQVVEADLSNARAMRRLLTGASFDLVVSSPPFFTLASGPPVPDQEEAIARHELRLTLSDVCREARRLLVPGGRAALVFPSDRLTELLGGLDHEGLRPTRLRAIHPRPGQPAQRVLVLAIKGGKGGLVIEPPLIVRDDHGYTPEVSEALGDG
ncbi:MAG TPA: tRNA1(Val) (adenine(37)-N6)-methyltransferase [Polyangia bacterium]|nr:tRNA1(Val) (adenine(37)-N6)-methyltransferase [Polyangia bacterium]